MIFHSYVNLPEGTKWGWVKTYDWLVVTGTMEWIMTFHSVGNVIIPTDELTPSFFRGVGLNHQPDRDIIKYIGNYRDISGYN